ncbi:MAG TPA: tetratricopeptide repeat protein [Gemmatimonadaceae bacterium]|nr:tetratricopeptide repeat protein [Gemmatimonadaceae bacterium]
MEAASIALATGDDAAAERALRAAIQSVEGKDHAERELVEALVKLGTFKQSREGYVEAEQLFRKALDVGQPVFGPNDLALVPVLSGLGAARIQNGAPGEAEQLLSRALSISENHLGSEHPDLVILLNDLSRLYLNRSAPEVAEPLLLRLLALKRNKGEDHPEVATVLASLASVQQALGRHDAAEQLWRRVLGIRERALAPNHFGIAMALEHLAATCAARGNVAEALQLHQRALAIRELTLGRDHASVRVSRERIADLRLQESDARDALTVPSPVPAVIPVPEAAPLKTPASVAVVPQVSLVPRADSSLAYMEVLSRIKDELDASRPEDESGGQVRSWFVRLGQRLRKPRAAAIVGAIIIMLPIAAMAAVRATRSGQSLGGRSAPAVAEFRPSSDTPMVHPLSPAAAPIDSDSVAAILSGRSAEPASGPEESPGRTGGERRGDARGGSRSGTRGAASAGRPAGDDDASARRSAMASVLTPSMSSVATFRLDSAVHAIELAGRAAASESLPLRFRSLLDSTDPPSGARSGAALRARLIGSMPSPRYPSQRLVGGRRVSATEVRARVDVDIEGRPVMSTFTVVGTPDSLFVAAVKEVIPGMRFEPARSPWPASQPVVDRVELTFRFAPRVK